MKRSIALLLALCLLLTACAKEPGSPTAATQSSTDAPQIQEITTAPTQSETVPSLQADPERLYSYLKDWVIENGTVNGDYVYYSNSASLYGGLAEDTFSLFYWGDTDTVEFTLHTVISEEYSFTAYLCVPKTFTGSYEYITSYYERSTGDSICESTGPIEAASFTKNYPLRSESYFGPDDLQTKFMETSRLMICNALDCLNIFLMREHLEYTFEDLGFVKFAS